MEARCTGAFDLDAAAVGVLVSPEMIFVSIFLESIRIYRAMVSRVVGLAVWSGTPMLVPRPTEICSRMGLVDVRSGGNSLQ